MAIETLCQVCGKLLRVNDEHAGKTARCPSCMTVYVVPVPGGALPDHASSSGTSGSGSSGSVATGPAAPAAGVSAPAMALPTLSRGAPADSPTARDQWHLKTAEGLVYGPVARAELDRWFAEGRITRQSQIRNEESRNWTWAGHFYPQLASAPAPEPKSSATANPAWTGSPHGSAYGDPAAGNAYNWSGPGHVFREPHRGVSILILALVGLVMCNLLSLAAIVMAAVDLPKMTRGTMERSGMGLTIAGLMLGILKLFVDGAILAHWFW